MKEPALVTFVGAGPGDPELLTIKGKRAIEEAELVLYAGSLVSPDVVGLAKEQAEIYDSALLTLEQTHALVARAAFAGKRVARIHTGDPSIYGALAEQIELLKRDGIPWRVIPGVTAAMAAAATSGISFSLPEISQSLLITRFAGRTPMPENEGLQKLAALNIPLAIYLGGHKSAEIQEQLLQVLAPETPVICASRIGWPEEKILRISLANLAEAAAANGIGRQTLILVLPRHGEKAGRSRLYDGGFGHSWRAPVANSETDSTNADMQCTSLL